MGRKYYVTIPNLVCVYVFQFFFVVVVCVFSLQPATTGDVIALNNNNNSCFPLHGSSPWRPNCHSHSWQFPVELDLHFHRKRFVWVSVYKTAKMVSRSFIFVLSLPVASFFVQIFTKSATNPHYTLNLSGCSSSWLNLCSGAGRNNIFLGNNIHDFTLRLYVCTLLLLLLVSTE